MLRCYYLAIFLMLAACASNAPEQIKLSRTSYTELVGWATDDHVQALQVFLPSCQRFARKALPASGLSRIAISASQWDELCGEGDKALASNDPEKAKEFFEINFVPFSVSNGKQSQGLFTGYYEPSLNGSRKAYGPYRYPLYAVPPNKAYTRAQIEAGALKNQGLEIAWVDDPVMLFFLQIQGSGRIYLPNETEMRVGYADKNGFPYISLGKVMEQQGLLEPGKVDFFTIRDWLRQNPTRASAVMNENPSYVYFTELTGLATNPPGAAGVPLTPLRSLAVDRRFIPYGLPLFLQTRLPDTDAAPSQAFNRLMIAQDTGGAIKGAVRGDIFFGHGTEAENWAGLMKGKGRYTLLLPAAIAAQYD